MRIRPVEGLTLRIALLAGFGLTFGVWLITGYVVTQRMATAEQEAAVLNARYRASQELLSQVRAQVLLASVYVRDALLEPDTELASADRVRAQEAYRTIDASLAQYVPIFDSPIERERVARLRDEVGELRSAAMAAMALENDGPRASTRALMERVRPRREAAIAISEDAQSLNRSMFVAQRDAATAVQVRLQQQAWTLFGIALAIGAAIAWLAFRYGLSLEAQLVEQRQREQQTAADLQRLSARVVSVQEDERRRIAHELHDEVGQALTALQVELALARQSVQRAGGGRDLLREAEALASGALRTVRDLSQLLHPSALDDLGLVAALGSFVRGFEKRHRIHMELAGTGVEGQLVPDTERAVYRIVQEALTNVARHARARSCAVRLSREGSALRVVVEDDGVGFDAAGVQRPGRREGLGLLGMRERVAQLHGSFRVVSAPEISGTRIEIMLPGAFEGEAETDGRTAAGAAVPDREPALVRAEVERG